MQEDSWPWRTAVLLGWGVLAAALVASPAAAHTPPADGAPLFLESVGTDAIPRDVVAALAQDRHGLLWIATGDGLVRYDGHEFRAQELDSPDPARRSLGWIRALLPGRDGRVWIGSESQGLASFDPVDGRIGLHPMSHAAADRGGAPPQIQALAEDSAGAIWAGYRGEGLHRYDRRSGLSVAYRHEVRPGTLPDDRIEALHVARDGTLWIGSWQGLSRLRPGMPGQIPARDAFAAVFSSGPGSLAGRTVRALLEAADGRIWVGTQQGDLALVDPQFGGGRLLPGPGGAATRGPVSSLVQAADGTLWVGHSMGIDLHDPDDGRLLQRLRHQSDLDGGLAANEVTSLLRDQAGWIWLGGIGVGLQRHNPNNRSIEVHGIAPAPGARPREADVRALRVDGQGAVWVSTLDGGVVVLDRQLRLRRRIALAGDRPEAPPAPVVAMSEDAAGHLWLASDVALHEVDRTGRVRRRLRHGLGTVFSLQARADGTLWLASQDGLYRLPAGGTALQRVGLAGGQALSGDVYALAEAPDGALWVGSVKGLYRLPPGASSLQPVAAAEGRGLASPVVIGLLFDRRGTLWLDTAVAGLHRLVEWDGRLAAFDAVSQRHGQAGRPFGVNLLEDERGRIWTHMQLYDPAADRLDTLSGVDGARLGNGRFHVKARMADGTLLFGGTKGLMVVHGARFERQVGALPLVVSALRVDGQAQPTGPRPQRLEIGAGARQFGVEFAALDYSEPRKLRYRYRLEGHDRGWIETGADLRVASYGNLAPGRYQLQVQAADRSGLWRADGLTLPVQVAPAWWQTWPVRAGFGLLAVGAVVLVWRTRTRVLRHRQALLEDLVQQRTAVLAQLSHELQLRSAALEEASQTDPLTGLPNRRQFGAQIETLVARALRRHEAAAQRGQPPAEDADLVFFLLDVDHFKAVNDHHGHAAGDAVLVQIGQRLREVFRGDDLLVRWGGEEFLALAVGCARDQAEVLAERLRAVMAERPFVVEEGAAAGRVLHKSCSVGYAVFPLLPERPRAVSWSQVLNLADAALYRVKTGGRNGWLGVIGARVDDSSALAACLRRPFEATTPGAELLLRQGGPGLPTSGSPPEPPRPGAAD